MSTYEIIMTILAIVFGGLSIYFKSNAKLTTLVGTLINEAEEVFKDSTKAGGDKFEYVVNKLYGLLPKGLKPFISEKLIKAIIQKTFEIMEAYAKKQLDNVVNKTIPETISKDEK